MIYFGINPWVVGSSPTRPTVKGFSDTLSKLDSNVDSNRNFQSAPCETFDLHTLDEDQTAGVCQFIHA